ncbi:GNAT family N-acetyltransferase [Streptomyces sp. CoH27]|uniref:GNAT family N-acetyltransferase n=1 Tax=Streptomyces sp. CoH27 TaxID=2875763 RepID=UPI001CD26A16|nr:GNAT family N-acetyltransferase [Streptomyces sp. CoH27]
MIIRLAGRRDLPGFLRLAAQVEHWFGPMVDDPGFTGAVEKHIRRSTALVAQTGEGCGEDSGTDLLGALLFGGTAPVHKVHWLVVSEQSRRTGVGRALLTDAARRWVHAPASLEVVTFGKDHPGAAQSGARAFYEHLGFTPSAPAPPGPEGGSRQRYHRAFP